MWYVKILAGITSSKRGLANAIVLQEALPDPSTAELQKEAQEEARVFAAQGQSISSRQVSGVLTYFSETGMIVNLQRTLDGLDISRGDRLDDPELEGLYQKVVELQPQIVSLMKKYADQRGKQSVFRCIGK